MVTIDDPSVCTRVAEIANEKWMHERGKRVTRGLKTNVTVYTTIDYEQAWDEALNSLRP